MLPVVHETGGPPLSRRRRRATIFHGVVSNTLGNSRNVGSSRITRPISTFTVMTTAFSILMVLLPAAYPDKISIGECLLRRVTTFSEFAYGYACNRLACVATRPVERCATTPTVMEGCCTRLVAVYSRLDGSKYSVLDARFLRSKVCIFLFYRERREIYRDGTIV